MFFRLLWLSIITFSNTLMAFQSSLSETQCARFYKEYQNIAIKMNSNSGESLQSLANRYGRLQERLDAFCQHTQYTISESKTSKKIASSNHPEKTILFSDEAKQSAWESFYTAPSYCLSKPVSSVNKLRCKNELDRFKELFEQQWKQNNTYIENNLDSVKDDKNDIQKTTNQPSQVIVKEKTDIEPAKNTSKLEQVKQTQVTSYNSGLQPQTTGLDTLFVYIEDYLFIFILLFLVLFSARYLAPTVKKLLTKHFSYIAVNKYLMKHLSVTDYTLYSKISLPIPSGMADIDELILSPYGIFVISCQPQIGRVYADTTSEVWTEQVGKNRNSFPNPNKQLPLKLAGVKQLFGIEEHIYGLIVFDQEVDFRTNMPSNVIQTGQLLSKIEQYDDAVYTQEQISHFVLLLSEYKASNPFKEIISKLGQKRAPKSEWES